MSMKDEVRWELTILFLQQTLIMTYEGNCPLKHVKTDKNSLKWTSEQESFRRAVRWVFNKCHTERTP
jgi:hypothetical protein